MEMNRKTKICTAVNAKPVRFAINALIRDFKAVFGAALEETRQKESNQICISQAPCNGSETFSITVDHQQNIINIAGHDDLGCIAGIYWLCEHVLLIDPFYFWTDFSPTPREKISVSIDNYKSDIPQVAFRGWFVNDEDCLIGWHDEMKISLQTWEKIFETILRSGYNMVIPGTGEPAINPQWALASDMGLYLTHHHVEPLGARLFREAYGSNPSLPEDLPRLEALYREAIDAVKDRKTIWILGYRGQGDNAAKFNKTKEATEADQAKALSEMIKFQKKMVEKYSNDPAPRFGHYIYAESAGYYRNGWLSLDDDLIRVFSDNGFGAMRARRHGTKSEPYIPAEPLQTDAHAPAGIYYHVSFHDLVSSGLLVPYTNPSTIAHELTRMREIGKIEYLILNVSNIRPHIFNIELVRNCCTPKTETLKEAFTAEEIVNQTYAALGDRYFGTYAFDAETILREYFSSLFRFGPREDQAAGEQFFFRLLRKMIASVLKGKGIPADFSFIDQAPEDPESALQFVHNVVEEAIPKWKQLKSRSADLELKLEHFQRQYYQRFIGLPVDFMFYSHCMFREGCEGIVAYVHHDYRKAFTRFYSARKWAERAGERLQQEAQGKWLHFYRGDWLTGVQNTIECLGTAQGIARIYGDSGWRSQWTTDAMGITPSPIHTLQQVWLDNDNLAQTMLKRDQK